MVRLSESWW